MQIDTITMATGLLVPVWTRLQDKDVTVWRIDDGEGVTILGRIIPSYAFEALEREFGLESNLPLSVEDIIAGAGAVEGMAIPGLKPARLMQVHVNNSRRLEILGYAPEDLLWLKAMGAFSEVIQCKTCLFLPIDRAGAILEQIIANRR